MKEVTWISAAACLTTVIIDLLIIVAWFFKRTYHHSFTVWPKVSILVAARNEEYHITRCMKSLLLLDYPHDQLEILIGDDASEDRTYDIVKKLANDDDRVKIFFINEELGNARGKANVLAHLAKKATGEFYFITDADVAVPSSWVKGMLSGQHGNTGIITGVTGIEDNVFQHTDWLFALGMVKVITDMNQPVTAMGNNMVVTREAYEAVGGYETIPFSITEDFELFKQVRKKGFGVVQLFDREIFVWSKSIKGVSNLLYQRKRWMLGAIQLPWPIVTLLVLQAVYYPGLILLFFLNLKAAVVISILKISLQSVFIGSIQMTLRQKIRPVVLLLYEVFSCFLSISSVLFFLIPVGVKWKGRKY